MDACGGSAAPAAGRQLGHVRRVPAMKGTHLTLVFLLALAARGVHVWSLRGSAWFDTLMGDARAYDAWATRIAAGDWLGTEVFYQAPLYPYFLGAIYSIAGRDLLLVRIVQAALGAVSATLIASAGARLFSPRVGLVTGVAMALYAPAIFFDSLLQKTVLDVLLVSTIVWIVSRILTAGQPRATAWLALGIALGALGLSRENALALTAVAVAWAITSGRTSLSPAGGREPRTARRQGAAPRLATPASWLPLAALVCGLTLVLSPVVLRNFVVGGGVYLTTAQFGPNFFIGNNPAADGTYMSLRPGRGAPEFERLDATDLAEQAIGRPLSPSEVSAYWRERALAFILSDPLAWARLMLRKTALLLNATEMLDTESQESYAELSPVLRGLGPAGHFGVLLPLAALGWLAAWPQRRRLWVLYAMPAVYALSVVVFFVFARYRFPLVPFLMLFAGLGAVSAPGLFRRASVRQRVGVGLGLAALVAVTFWPLLSPARMRAISETNLAVALYEAGRLEEALSRLDRAVALQPDYLPAHNNRGITLRALGRLDEAIAAYQHALRLEASADVQYNLATALLQQQRSNEAERLLLSSAGTQPGTADVHNNLGSARAAAGDVDGAIRAFRAAIAADPRHAGTAHRNLGNLLATTGRINEALVEFDRALALDARDTAALYDAGSVLLEQQRYEEAASRFHAVLAVEPGHVRAMNNLGVALASQGRVRDALPFFERAVQLQPDFADARRNLQQARAALGGRER